MSSPLLKGRPCNMKLFFLFLFFGVLLPVAAKGLPFSSPEHNTLMPASDSTHVIIPDAKLETTSEGLLEILAGLVQQDSSPSNVGQLKKGLFSIDVPAELVEPLTLPEHKTLMPAKDQSNRNNPDAAERTDIIPEGYKIKPFHGENEDQLQTPSRKAQVNHNIPSGVDKSIKPSGFKPPTKLNITVSIIFLVLIAVLFLIDVVRFSKDKIRRLNAARMREGESAISEPPLTLTSRVWEGISSLFGPKEAASSPQMSPVSDDDAAKSVSTTDKSKHGKKAGSRIFSWRPWKQAQQIVPQNNPELDTVAFIEVPGNQIEPPLEQVVCHGGEAFNHQATDKPCYTESGLTEVSIS